MKVKGELIRSIVSRQVRGTIQEVSPAKPAIAAERTPKKASKKRQRKIVELTIVVLERMEWEPPLSGGGVRSAGLPHNTKRKEKSAKQITLIV